MRSLEETDLAEAVEDRRIIAFDPGGTTGIAIWTPDHIGMQRVQLGPQEHHEVLENTLYDFEPDVIVTERFDYRPKQGHADLSPVEYIGVMKLYSQKFDVPVVQQKQLKGHKGLWTDDKIKALNLWIPGKPHAMDATRQLLFYMTEEGCFDWIEAYGRAIGKDIE